MKTLVLTSLLGLSGFLTSCQSTSSAPTAAVSCDKCRTVSFIAPSTSPGTKGIITLRNAASMSCPDCENQVIAMLKSGSATKHVCKSCGGTLHHCVNH